MKNKRGFTIVEFAIVTAVLSIVAVFAFPAYKAFEFNNKLSVSKNNIITALTEARNMASAQAYDSNSGVYITNSNLTVFSGIDYVSRDVSKDKVFDLPAGIVMSGDNEIIFQKLTGLPLTSASLNISYGEKNFPIIISNQGIFNY